MKELKKPNTDLNYLMTLRLKVLELEKSNAL